MSGRRPGRLQGEMRAYIAKRSAEDGWSFTFDRQSGGGHLVFIVKAPGAPPIRWIVGSRVGSWQNVKNSLKGLERAIAAAAAGLDPGPPYRSSSAWLGGSAQADRPEARRASGGCGRGRRRPPNA